MRRSLVRQPSFHPASIADPSEARNIFLLTLIIDEETSNDALWDIYYHLYLNDNIAATVQAHLSKLLPLLSSLNSWKKSQYGTKLRFCDEDTLDDVRAVYQRMA